MRGDLTSSQKSQRMAWVVSNKQSVQYHETLLVSNTNQEMAWLVIFNSKQASIAVTP